MNKHGSSKESYILKKWSGTKMETWLQIWGACSCRWTDAPGRTLASRLFPRLKSQNQHQAIFRMIWEFRISYQVLAGSHHMGRVDHFLMGGQSGADPGRVEMAKKFGCQHLHVEMEPGDALFFHSNLLHTRSRMGRDLASNLLTI